MQVLSKWVACRLHLHFKSKICLQDFQLQKWSKNYKGLAVDLLVDNGKIPPHQSPPKQKVANGLGLGAEIIVGWMKCSCHTVINAT